jgi:hypothetical protein
MSPVPLAWKTQSGFFKGLRRRWIPGVRMRETPG